MLLERWFGRTCSSDELKYGNKLKTAIMQHYPKSKFNIDCYDVGLIEAVFSLAPPPQKMLYHLPSLAVTCQRNECVIEGDIILPNHRRSPEEARGFVNEIREITVVTSRGQPANPCSVSAIHEYEKTGKKEYHVHVFCVTEIGDVPMVLNEIAATAKRYETPKKTVETEVAV